MNYFNTKINRKVLEFKNEIQNLKIIERDIPLNSAIFFEELWPKTCSVHVVL